MGKQLAFLLGLSQVLVLFHAVAGAAEGFPGRAEFPEIPVYELHQVFNRLDRLVLVDARSGLEFNTLRIKGAVNIPVAAKDFAQQVVELRKKTRKPIVFYCNGRSCYKSYHAVARAQKAGVRRVYAYDAGVFEWARAYPQHAVLLGKSPVEKEDLIPKTKYQAHLLDPESFSRRALTKSKAVQVLDVRDMFQRGGFGFFPGRERWVSLDETAKLERYIDKAIREKRTLLIYDEVGKQVRWLQYTLEKAGLKNYYFMQKGARGYYRMLQRPSSSADPVLYAHRP